MSDRYQLGSDVEWLKHSNEELSKLVKKHRAQVIRLRMICLALLLLLCWVVFKFTRALPLEELWQWTAR